jgi:hypothetical protein
MNTHRGPPLRSLLHVELPQKFAPALASIRRFALWIVIGLAAVSIISASYVGLNGVHVWRQSDCYSQILGLLGQPGLGPLDNFQGMRVIFDIPIYQAVIASLATITRAEPLVIVRMVGGILFVVFAIAGYRIAEVIKPGSGLVLAVLIATSPLYLEYFATPLPDILSLTCSTVAVMLLFGSGPDKRYWLVLLLLGVGSLIKSPVPFIFLVFYMTWLVLNWRSVSAGSRSWVKIGGLLGVSFSAAVVAELIRRGVSEPRGWTVDNEFSFGSYFGHLRDRISPNTWKVAYHYAISAFAFRWLAVAAVIALVLYAVLRRLDAVKLMLPLFLAFASGWLIFTPLYDDHDYYGLPTTFMLLLAASIAVTETAGLIGRGSDMLTILVTAVLVLAVPLILVYGNRTSSYGITSEGQAIRFILRDVKQFAYVTGEAKDNTAIGGLAAKPFTKMSPSEFETNCAAILNHVRAVVVLRSDSSVPSKCLAQARDSSVSFMVGPVYQVFLLHN